MPFTLLGSKPAQLRYVLAEPSVQAKLSTGMLALRSRPIQIEPDGRNLLRMKVFSAASSIDTRCPPWLTA